MNFGSLFSGIGGIDLGLERAGLHCKWQVEIDDYCNKVLEKHWPDVRRFRDVKECGSHNLEPVDLICGGFPCQPVSYAGRQLASKDERWLWPAFRKIIGLLRPCYVLVENVSGLLSHGIGQVLRDLACFGYDAEWDCLRASEFGAAIKRTRVYIVAFPNSLNGQTGMGPQPFRSAQIFKEDNRQLFPFWLQTADQFIGMADRLPFQLYEARGRAIGNAVVPQVAEWIGRRIMEFDSRKDPE